MMKRIEIIKTVELVDLPITMRATYLVPYRPFKAVLLVVISQCFRGSEVDFNILGLEYRNKR